MVDTGATHSLISLSTLSTFSHPPIQPTSTTTAVLGDPSTTITVRGFVRLCIYMNHIPTYASVFVVDSLGVDFILGMDWCFHNNVLLCLPEQKLLVRHPFYGTTTVQFLDSVSVPIRLAQSIQLLPHHEHLVRLVAPLSSAFCVRYTPDDVFCRRKNIYLPHALLKVNRFQSHTMIHNCASTPCTLRKGTVLGALHFFNTFPLLVNITSFSLPSSLSN